MHVYRLLIGVYFQCVFSEFSPPRMPTQSESDVEVQKFAVAFGNDITAGAVVVSSHLKDFCSQS